MALTGGHWVTINGAHIFIKDGQSPEEAIAERASTASKATRKRKTKTAGEVVADYKAYKLSPREFRDKDEGLGFYDYKPGEIGIDRNGKQFRYAGHWIPKVKDTSVEIDAKPGYAKGNKKYDINNPDKGARFEFSGRKKDANNEFIRVGEFKNFIDEPLVLNPKKIKFDYVRQEKYSDGTLGSPFGNVKIKTSKGTITASAHYRNNGIWKLDLQNRMEDYADVRFEGELSSTIKNIYSKTKK